MPIKFKAKLKPKKKNDDFWDSKVMIRARATQAAIKAKKIPRPRTVRVKVHEATVAKKSFAR